MLKDFCTVTYTASRFKSWVPRTHKIKCHAVLVFLRKASRGKKNSRVPIDLKKPRTYSKILLRAVFFADGQFPAFGRYQIRRVIGEDPYKTVFNRHQSVLSMAFISDALRSDDPYRIRSHIQPASPHTGCVKWLLPCTHRMCEMV